MKIETRIRKLEARMITDPVVLFFSDGTRREIQGGADLMLGLMKATCGGADVTPWEAEQLELIRTSMAAREPGHLLAADESSDLESVASALATTISGSMTNSGAMQPSSERFNRITSNFVTSEVHRSSPTIARLHELLADYAVGCVCDVACGAGHLGLSFAGKASRIVAVDPAPNMLAAALLAAEEKQVALETHNAPAEALPLRDGEFDLTVSRLAPHHFSDVYAGIREMARVTKIGGRVSIIDLEGNENQEYDEFNHRLEVLHDPTHVRSYTAARWRDIFQKAGLVIELQESGLSERPAGVPVKRWCEIAASGEKAETEINRLLRNADPGILSALGIRQQEAAFLMPIRTVLTLARRAG